jgi:hypothetical protein
MGWKIQKKNCPDGIFSIRFIFLFKFNHKKMNYDSDEVEKIWNIVCRLLTNKTIPCINIDKQYVKDSFIENHSIKECQKCSELKRRISLLEEEIKRYRTNKNCYCELT